MVSGVRSEELGVDENEELSASGDVRCGILGWVFWEKESALGRAGLKPVNGAILAGCCRFRHDGRNMAFSSRGLCSCN